VKSGRRWVWNFVRSALAVATVPAAAPAACPEVFCDCLGEAAQYQVVASDEVNMQPGSYPSEGNAVYDGSSAFAVCTTTGFIKGTTAGANGGGAASVEHFVALAGPGRTAVRASSVGDVSAGPNVNVTLLVTGGGSFVGAGEADVQQLDTSGTHAQVSACTQAVADMQTASETLAALTPTQEYDKIVLTGDDELDINAGPGVNVIKVGEIVLRSSPAFLGTELRINTLPETDSVIINTGFLSVGPISRITGSKTIINVAGPGPGVRYLRHADVDVPVLAPQRSLKIAPSFRSTTSLYTRRLLSRGAVVQGACP
jgi:hypothetical protein